MRIRKSDILKSVIAGLIILLRCLSPDQILAAVYSRMPNGMLDTNVLRLRGKFMLFNAVQAKIFLVLTLLMPALSIIFQRGIWKNKPNFIHRIYYRWREVSSSVCQAEGFKMINKILMIIIWSFLSLGSIIYADPTWAKMMIIGAGGEVSGNTTNADFQRGVPTKRLNGLGSIDTQISNNTDCGSASASATLSIASAENSAKIIETFTGNTSAIDKCSGVIAYTMSMTTIGVTLDIVKPTKIILEIDEQLSMSNLGNSFASFKQQINGQNIFIADETFNCDAPLTSCTRNKVFRYGPLDLSPSEAVYVTLWRRSDSRASIFSNPSSSHAGNFTYTIRLIEQTGCHGLTLDLFPSFPDTIWPTLMPSGSHDNTALVEPKVSSPAPVGGCVVNFDVEPVSAKGHSSGHTSGIYPKDKAGKIEMGGKAITSCTIPEGETTCRASDGSISPIGYTAPEISGEEKITATLADTGEKASKSIFTMVPDLGPLSSLQFYRLTGQNGKHPDNHYGTNDTIARIQNMAQDYFDLPEVGDIIGINDMSLPWGGLFDVFGDWKTPHGMIVGVDKHRIGKAVDIDRCALSSLVNQDALDRLAKKRSGKRIVEEPDESPQCRLPDGSTPPTDTPLIHYDFP